MYQFVLLIGLLALSPVGGERSFKGQANGLKIDDKSLIEQFQLESQQLPDVFVDETTGEKIVRSEYQGSRVEAPFFDDQCYVTEGKRDFDRRTMATLEGFIKKCSEKLLEHNQSIFVFGIRNIMSIHSLFRGLRKDSYKFLQTDKSIRSNEKFLKSMGKMVKDVADARSDVKLDGKSAHRETVKILGAVRELVDRSPVGLYLDWNRETLDGRPLLEQMAPIIQYLRDTGRQKLLTVLRGLGDNLSKEM